MMHVSYCANNAYAMQLCVSIVSLLENNKEQEVTVHVLSSNLEKKNEAIISHCVEKYKQSIFFYNIKGCLNTIKKTALNLGQDSGGESYWEAMGLEAYARFFIADVIPESVSQVIYFDCDTIICNSIRNIFAYGNNKVVAAVIDYWPANYIESIGGGCNDKYFNSGVQLINLDKWREKNVLKKYLDYISTIKKPWRCFDQDIMNVVLSNEIATLPLEYNMMYAARHFSIKELYAISKKDESTYYNEKELQGAKNNIIVIHFAGELMEKPWRCLFADIYTKQWKRYFQLTPYAKDGLRKCMNVGLGIYYLKTIKHFCEYFFYKIVGKKGRFYIINRRTQKYVNEAIKYNEG